LCLEVLQKADRHLTDERSAALQYRRLTVLSNCSQQIDALARGRHAHGRPLANRIPRRIEVCSNRFPRLIDRDDRCVFIAVSYFFSSVCSYSSRSSSSAEAG